MPCICDDWKKWMPVIESQQIFCAHQAAGPKYKGGAPFRYCPWCGEFLDAEWGKCVECGQPVPPGAVLCGDCMPF